MSILRTPLQGRPRQVLSGGQTMKCTQIGLEDQARALAGLPAPTVYASVELSGMCRDLGGVLRQEVSRGDSNGERPGGSENAKTPSEEGVSSFLVTD
jgi:hypothetical protein